MGVAKPQRVEEHGLAAGALGGRAQTLQVRTRIGRRGLWAWPNRSASESTDWPACSVGVPHPPGRAGIGRRGRRTPEGPGGRPAARMAEIPARARPLFGGAFSATLPAGSVDASALRPVPDHQEVFCHRACAQSLVLELLQLQSHVRGEAAARSG